MGPGETMARVLRLPRAVDVPTYERDRVGEIRRRDERENTFARHDLFRYFGDDSQEYESYYRAHPSDLPIDEEISRLPGLAWSGGNDAAMYLSVVESVLDIASEAAVDGRPAAARAKIPPARAALKVKEFATILGAEMVGTGPLRQEWVHSHVGRSFGNREGFQPWGTPVDLRHHTDAVSMEFRMDHDLIQSAPDFPVLLATVRGYSVGAWVSVQLARYIRLLGYSARAHHLFNYRVLSVPVAVDCGLGELSRAGFLLTREMGLGLRLGTVTTDLPLEHDPPVDIGVQSFCERCKICAENCPSGAIPTGEKIEYNGIMKWQMDAESCYKYWNSVGSDCSLCLTTCPWTKPPTRFHRAMSYLAGIPGPHQSLMVQADKLFYGSGKVSPAPRPEFLDPPPRRTVDR
jgi:ferredoxin